MARPKTRIEDPVLGVGPGMYVPHSFNTPTKSTLSKLQIEEGGKINVEVKTDKMTTEDIDWLVKDSINRVIAKRLRNIAGSDTNYLPTKDEKELYSTIVDERAWSIDIHNELNNASRGVRVRPMTSQEILESLTVQAKQDPNVIDQLTELLAQLSADDSTE